MVGLMGCAATPKFSRYSEFSKVSTWFEIKNAPDFSMNDFLEISLRYMMKDSLDSFFSSLNLTGSGETVYSMQPQNEINVKSIEFYKRRQRVQGLRKFLTENDIVTKTELDLLEPFLFRLNTATVSNSSKKFNFVAIPSYWLLTENSDNPYNIQEYQTISRTGSVVTLHGESASISAYSSSDRRHLTGEMGLDVFEISITNNSSVNKYIDTKNLWLVDDLGNQQSLLDVDYFEKLYSSGSENIQQPLRLANIRRTILSNSPIFPGQVRKAFIAFYPIPVAAKSFKIYWSPKDSLNKTLSWAFTPDYEIKKNKYLNFGIYVKSSVFTSTPYKKDGIKNVLIFMKPVDVVGISGEGGISSGLVNYNCIGNAITLYAIAAGDAKQGQEKLSVFYGSQKIVIDSEKNKQGPEFVDIEVKPYTVNLP
jgi:hypothetical protein